MGDWGWQRGAKVQIGAELLCEGAKVEARVQSSDYGVRRDGRGTDVVRRTDATQSRPYPRAEPARGRERQRGQTRSGCRTKSDPMAR